MASASRTQFAGSPNLPSSDFSSSPVDPLSEKLSVQRAVLDYLLDISESAEEDIAAARAEIANLERQIAQAGSKAAPPAAHMGDAGRDELAGGNHGSHSQSTASAMDSTSGIVAPQGPGLLSRKRSLGSSHLDIDPSYRALNKSRRTTPDPGLDAFQPGFDDFGDSDFQDFSVIDLTGDNDDEWRLTIQRQKEEEDRLRRRKADVDRDAALARHWAAQTSTPTNGYATTESSHPAQTDASSWILGRYAQPSTSVHTDQSRINPKPDTPLVTRPRDFPGSGADFLAGQSGPSNLLRSPQTVSESEANRYRVPGAYVDSDSDDGGLVPGRVRYPTAGPSRASVNPVPPSLSHHAPGPLPSLPTPFGSFGTANHYSPSTPAIELARQSSMARQDPHIFGSPSPLTANAPTFPSVSPDRPGFMNMKTYPWLSAPVTPLPSLATAINRVSTYNFDTLVDGDGNPFDKRLVNFLDDFVNDPRKTDEDVQKLLSNIRPDMDIPEEERGETPEAMKYPLYPHQQLALKWMKDMEEGSNKGGILADDMGLGKTISTLSLMVSRQSSDDIKTNLIIGPVALIKQWEHEVMKKLKDSHRMSVLLLHQRKRHLYTELRRYSVVLTTYGSIASEWRQYKQHVEQRKDAEGYDEGEDMELARKCPLLHPHSKFYRVILDEAQCIKNKDTQGSLAVHKINATYRWCLTGTPMMNNVTELYPLIRFLRIRPYCDFKTFQRDFRGLAAKSNTAAYTRDTAMRKLQAVLKAIMLRRMKNSMIDGKPILTLPEKTEISEHVVFSEDEQQFYKDLESRTRIQFNRYLRAGTVAKNYSNILALLLRLRQACCHPHLMDFEYVGSATSDTEMVELAKDMTAAVVERIKAIEAFECPICYDVVADPVLLIPCGHDTCSECFASLTDNSAQNNIRSGNENGAARCPVCRGPVDPAKVTNYTSFQKAHMPQRVEPAEAEELPDSDTESSTADDTDSDAESVGSLADFVVPDDVDEFGSDEDARIDPELAAVSKMKETRKTKETEEARQARQVRKQSRKAKKSSKAEGKIKSKSDEVKPYMLKTLRNEASKNKEARRKYMHYLRDNWEDSAKVSRVIELLGEIQETNEKTIIFSQWTALLDLIECQIKYNLKIRYRRYTGDMSRNQRDESVRDFTEDPNTRVLLVSLRAGNAGLNLTTASRVIICDPFWNPYIEMQAVDRAHRIGQQREVKVHRVLVKETVEDRILDLQEEKRRLVEAALDEGSSKSVGRLGEQELRYLFGVNQAR